MKIYSLFSFFLIILFLFFSSSIYGKSIPNLQGIWKGDNIQSFCAEFSENTNMNEGKYAKYIASKKNMSLAFVEISSKNYIDNYFRDFPQKIA